MSRRGTEIASKATILARNSHPTWGPVAVNHPDKPQADDDPTAEPASALPDAPTQVNPSSPSDESPDRDTPAWEGAEPNDAVGLIDPRPEIPTPPGL